MTIVTPKTSLPLKTFINKGSYEQRLKYAQELNAKFYEKIKTKIVNGFVSAEDYYTTMKEIIPEINFKIDEYKSSGFFDNVEAQTVIETDENNHATGFSIQLPFAMYQCKNIKIRNLIPVKNFYLAMHENFHLFAEICLPKHIARQDFNSNREGDLYENLIYASEDKKFDSNEKLHWERTLKKGLESLSLKKRIDFLQTCRYRLIEEKLAWEECKKYSDKNFDNAQFYFDEKIKIIETLLYKQIKKVRNEHKPSFWSYLSKCFLKKVGR